ncbi:unnamed protein product, partial [Discosporangium mesarthrocarpum]
SFFAANDIEGNAFYPLISARVTAINGAEPDVEGDMDDGESNTLTESTAREETGSLEPSANEGGSGAGSDEGAADGEDEEGREVRGRLGRRQVTWATDLPNDNNVTAGNWWGENAEPGYVSIEEDYADWLDLELGDVLEFEVNQQTVSAEVSSFRSVRWDNMQPNFFIIFSPGTIDHLGATFLSTARMESEQKVLLNDLIRLFPTMVVIEIDALIEQIQNIIAQVTSAIELISVLVLVCGALVLLACVNA